MFKPLRLSDSTVYVSARDPAIDWDRVADREIERDESLRALDVSTDERRGAALVKFAKRMHSAASKQPSVTADWLLPKDGQRVVKFVIGVIPPGELARIHDECRVFTSEVKSAQLAWRSFIAGLRDIKDGPWDDVPKRKVDGVEYVDPMWIGKTFVRGMRDVAEQVGSATWAWNQLTEDDAKN